MRKVYGIMRNAVIFDQKLKLVVNIWDHTGLCGLHIYHLGTVSCPVGMGAAPRWAAATAPRSTSRKS